MRERAADVSFSPARLSMIDRLVAPVALDAGDRAQVDDRAAVDLPERFRVELVEQLLDRLLDQRLAVGGDDLRVLVLGLEVERLVDGDQLHRRAERRADPLERCRRASSRARASRAAPARSSGGAASRALSARDDLGDALRRRRLQHVVDRAFVERRDRVLVVGGDEDDVAGAGELARDLEARLAPASGCRGTRRRARARRRSASASLAVVGLGDDRRARATPRRAAP